MGEGFLLGGFYFFIFRNGILMFTLGLLAASLLMLLCFVDFEIYAVSRYYILLRMMMSCLKIFYGCCVIEAKIILDYRVREPFWLSNVIALIHIV